MARKTTAQLLAEIVALFPDNTTGFITPLALRTSLTNICESFTDAYGALQGLPTVGQALTATVAKLAAFDTILITTPEVTPSAVNDNMVLGATAGYAFEFTTSLNGPNNTVVRFVARKNGIETVWTFQATLTGGGNTAEVSFSGFINAVATDVIDIAVSSLTGNATVNFAQNSFVVHDVQQ
jgi:hypothetical protein